ncbi:MAG: hypothetical protein JWM68_1780 [Verrucomicrobiales bacterium]|nr:hypothetical protein [Verrucomicrobiales bacterium]
MFIGFGVFAFLASLDYKTYYTGAFAAAPAVLTARALGLKYSFFDILHKQVLVELTDGVIGACLFGSIALISRLFRKDDVGR